jgi:hypothetical protein
MSETDAWLGWLVVIVLVLFGHPVLAVFLAFVLLVS